MCLIENLLIWRRRESGSTARFFRVMWLINHGTKQELDAYTLKRRYTHFASRETETTQKIVCRNTETRARGGKKNYKSKKN